MVVDADRPILTPDSSVERRTDPDDPQGDYDRAGSLEPRVLRWRLDGEVLVLGEPGAGER